VFASLRTCVRRSAQFRHIAEAPTAIAMLDGHYVSVVAALAQSSRTD